MGTMRLVIVLGMAGLLFLAGCAEFSGGLLNSRVFSGTLMENKTAEGQAQRLNVGELDSWKSWHYNTHKGDGSSLIIKAEATF